MVTTEVVTNLQTQQKYYKPATSTTSLLLVIHSISTAPRGNTFLFHTINGVLFSYIAFFLDFVILSPMMQTTIQFPSGNTLVLNSMAVALLYSIAYDVVILDQNGQLCLPF